LQDLTAVEVPGYKQIKNDYSAQNICHYIRTEWIFIQIRAIWKVLEGAFFVNIKKQQAIYNQLNM